MNNIDIVKRMDDLGRVVIPKELRRILKLCSNEPLKISIEDNKIVMKKYSLLSEFENVIKKFGEIINKISSKNVLITNRDKIIYSNIKEFTDKEISESLKMKIINREEINGLSNLEIIDGITRRSYYYSNIILINSEINGIIIIFDNVNSIEEKDKILIKVISEIFNYSL